jgi:hypothetical protein
MSKVANAFHSHLEALHNTNGTAPSSLLRSGKSPFITPHPQCPLAFHIFYDVKTIHYLDTAPYQKAIPGLFGPPHILQMHRIHR